MKALSLCITYHNEKKLLGECLKSIQSLPLDYEVLIFDDASEFPPRDYVPSGMPVTIIRSETNIGPAKARNRLFQAAQGKYIHFHDSDDWFLPTWAQETAAAIGKDLDVFFSEVDSYKNGTLYCEKILGLCELGNRDLVEYCIGKFMLVPSATIRRELVMKLGGFRETLWQSEDFDFYVRLAAEKPVFETSETSTVAIRLREESRSRNKIETLTSTLQALLLLKQELDPKYIPALAEKAAFVGSNFFQLGDREMAREAFQLSASLGANKFSYQNRLYAFIARRWGQELAEWVSYAYRSLVPAFVRRR